jgi:hypothetical protein
MQESFKPSNVSKVMLVSGAVCNAAVTALGNDWSPEGTGRFLGAVTFPLLIPLLVSLGVWRVSGRRQAAGNATLMALSGLMILAAFGQLDDMASRGRAVHELRDAQQSLRESLQAGSPEEVDTAYNQFAETVTNQFDALAENSTGDEARVYAVLADFTRESASRSNHWRELSGAVMAPEILDLDRLVRMKDYQEQLDTLDAYITGTKTFKADILGMLDVLTERLRPIGLETKPVQGVLAGYREKFEKQRPSLLPLLDAHVAYGESIRDVVRFLRRIDTHWSRSEGNTVLDTDEHISEYNALIDELTRTETELQELDAQFVALQ